MAKRTYPKKLDDLSREWDEICEKRHALIEKGRDISLTMVTAPYILEWFKNRKNLSVLDVGCGTGYLTNQIANLGNNCIGIDSSKKSIEIAKAHYSKFNTHFEKHKTKDYRSNIKFDVCVANMVFMDDPEWMESLFNIYSLLKDDGVLIGLITHPWFWPKYWKYEDEEWFRYNEELFIECSFSTTYSDALGTTTHIHRPLSMYVSGFKTTGFSIERIDELFPSKEMPEGYETRYPKFIGFVCGK